MHTVDGRKAGNYLQSHWCGKEYTQKGTAVGGFKQSGNYLTMRNP